MNFNESVECPKNELQAKLFVGYSRSDYLIKHMFLEKHCYSLVKCIPNIYERIVYYHKNYKDISEKFLRDLFVKKVCMLNKTQNQDMTIPHQN